MEVTVSNRIRILLLACVALLFATPPATAQQWFETWGPPRTHKPWRADAYRPRDPPLRAEREKKSERRELTDKHIREPMPFIINYPGRVIVIFRKYQQYSAYEGNMAAYEGTMPLRGPVCTGMPGRYETPLTDIRLGPRRIEYKQADYVSLTYPEPSGGAEMPHAMFFDRAHGLALHAGPMHPHWNGQPHCLSHGCVRLNPVHARILFEKFSDEEVHVIVVEDVADFSRWQEQVVVLQ